MLGGAGQDIFNFNAVAGSTSAHFDRIADFNAGIDLFHMSVAVGAVDAEVMGGNLTATNFDANLSAALGANQLHAGDAVLFQPSSGGLQSHLFLVVDANGTAGYQAGQDYVIDVTGLTGTFALANFV